MSPEFRQAVEKLQSKFELLCGAPPYVAGGSLPKEGVYLFCENGEPLYVGRSDNIPQRRRQHTQSGSRPNQAAFASLLARAETKRPIDYRKGARERLLADDVFMGSFSDAKKRIAKMEFRAVAESDPFKQALLEIYCAITLKTPYNDFRNR